MPADFREYTLQQRCLGVAEIRLATMRKTVSKVVYRFERVHKHILLKFVVDVLDVLLLLLQHVCCVESQVICSPAIVSVVRTRLMPVLVAEALIKADPGAPLVKLQKAG